MSPKADLNERNPKPPKRKPNDQPLSPEEALASMHTKPGLQIELVAAEPLVMDPVAFDWGPDGRLWVVEMRDYPNGLTWNGLDDPLNVPGGREDLDQMTEVGGAAHIGQFLGALKFMSHRDLVDRFSALVQVKAGLVAPAVSFPVEIFRLQERGDSYHRLTVDK